MLLKEEEMTLYLSEELTRLKKILLSLEETKAVREIQMSHRITETVM